MKPICNIFYWGMGLLLLCGVLSANLHADSLTFLGSTGGVIRDIAVYEDVEAGKTYLYVAQGAAIIIYDVTDGLLPVEVNRVFVAPSQIGNISISGGSLALSCFSYGVRVYSLVDPVHPQLVYTTGFNSQEVHMSGNLLYFWDIEFGSEPGNMSCTTHHYVYDIEEPSHAVRVDGFERCANTTEHLTQFIFVSDTRVAKPNIFWMFNRVFQEVIWNKASGLGIPPPYYDNEELFIFSPGMITSGYFEEYGFRNAVAYDDKVVITGTNSIYAYNPLIVDTTPEVIQIKIPDIDGGSLLDYNELYTSTSGGFQIIDFSDSNHPVKTNTVPSTAFEPRFIHRGIAYGIQENVVTIQNLKELESNAFKLIPVTLSKQHLVMNNYETGLRHISIEKFIPPRNFYGPVWIVGNQSIAIYLTEGVNSNYGILPKYLIMDDVEEPDHPITLDAILVGHNFNPTATLNGNILSIPAGESGTFHFLLDDAVLGTAVDKWQDY
jgi:hypothetical protein